jgi:hypothetical protein
MWGSTKSNVGATGNYLAMYDDAFAKAGTPQDGNNMVNYGATWTEKDGKYMITVDPATINNATFRNNLKNAAYIRCSMAACTGANFVVTLNDDLEDPTDGDNSGEQTYTETITGEFLDNTRLSTSGDKTSELAGFVTTPYFDISKYPDGFTIKLSGAEWCIDGTTTKTGYAHHFSPNGTYTFVADYTRNKNQLSASGYEMTCDPTTKEVTITTTAAFKKVFNKVRFSGKGTSANAVVQVIYNA